MLKFDSKIISVVRQLDSITEEIIETLSAEDVQLDRVDGLYNSRTVHISTIKEFLENENNKAVLEDNKADWNDMMENLRSKDERALGLLQSKVKTMEEELRTKEKQKNVLIYKENLK
jgi:hypothetical protein